MRLKYVNPNDCQRRYADEKARIAEFQFRNQSSWYSHANSLVRLAKISYAVGNPLDECRSYLRQATDAYRELFALRGTSFTTHIKYENDQPVSEERVADDGYTSVDSFVAALAALSVQNVPLARELVTLAGQSPNAALVSPQSEVCNSNEQTLSHALNALLAKNLPLAYREASKLQFRRGSQMEKQTATTISTIATEGDVLAELNALLSCHEKLAVRPDHLTDASFWLCLPALGLAYMAVHLGSIQRTDLKTESIYCPADFLLPPESNAG